MVVKVLRDRDPTHLEGPITRREVRRVLKEIVVAMVVFGVLVAVALTIALAALGAIQDSRYRSTKAACEDTNERNVQTQLELGRRQLPASRPAAGVREQIATTKLLIDRIIPYRPDCAAYARSRIKT